MSLVMSTEPIFTAIFSLFFLKSRLPCLDVVVLIVSFGGVFVMITGGSVDFGTKHQLSGWSLAIPIASLFLAPSLNALSFVYQRHVKEISPYAVGAYIAIFLTFMSGAILSLFEGGFYFFNLFGLIDYLILFFIGSMTTVVFVLAAKSSQYEEPAKVSFINYL